MADAPEDVRPPRPGDGGNERADAAAGTDAGRGEAAQAPVVAPALLHGAAFGAVLATLALVLLALGSLLARRAPDSWLVPVALASMSLGAGLALAPVDLVERLGARWPAGERRDLRVGLLAIAAGALGLALLTPQLIYINFGLGDPDRGVRHVMRWLGEVLRLGDAGQAFALGLLQVAAPFGPLAAARACRASLWSQTAVTVGYTLGLEAALLAAGKLLLGAGALAEVGLAGLLLAALLPLVRAGADRTAEAVRRALAPRPR